MKKVFPLLVMIAVSTAGYSQGITNKLSFQKDQKLEVYTQINRNSKQELMGQSMESNSTAAITSTLVVNDVNASGAAMESAMKRIKFENSMFGREDNFDSDNKEDMKGEMGRMMSKALSSKFTMVVDANGTVTAVKQPDEEKAKRTRSDEAAAGMIGMFMGGMNLGAAAPKVGDATLFKILPDKPVAKGETWTVETKDETAGTRKTIYTLTNLTEKDIYIDFTETRTLEKKQQMMGREVSVNSKEKSNGKIIIDRQTGLLKQKTFITSSEDNINAGGGMEMPSTSKMTTTITVKPI